MKKSSEVGISRRNFLKTNAIFLVGKVVLNDPVLRLLTASPGGPDWDFSIELLRTSDLLQLKHYFYNAEIDRGDIVARKPHQKVFVFIKLPAQHIAEELLDPTNIHQRSDFRQQRSLLGGPSWLGFELLKGALPMSLEVANLLNWPEKFRLLTLDDFVQTTYTDMLSKIGLAVSAQAVNEPVRQNAPSGLLPLTTFEIPYKMWLSPIAAPGNGDAVNNYPRIAGEHVFNTGNPSTVLYSCKQSNKQLVQILPVWENILNFRDQQQQVSAPRFKVVRSFCQDQSDTGISLLLPTPLNRAELHGLTMMPAYDRDVISDDFRVSALGGSTHLKYKNDDPTANFALVAWEQIVKYGRDNFVSVTFRAVDAITGFKMKVSVIAERSFLYGISYLPRLFHVDYFEPEKIYDDPQVISRIPFTRLVPKISGCYFKPLFVFQAPTCKTGAFVAAKPDYTQATFDANQLLEFGYTGWDKDGNQHDLKAKMILIPAEQYVIQTGQYVSVYNHIPYGPGDCVAFTDTGDLNPALEAGKPAGNSCNIPVGANYTFTLVKTFSTGQKALLGSIIDGVNTHINANKSTYGIILNKDLSYAKLTSLRGALIDRDSTNATLRTSSFLLNPQRNSLLFGPGPYIDFFQNSAFPILPTLTIANVQIPQIDQIRGYSAYYDVAYYDKYFNSQVELDTDQIGPKIFLKLTPAINGFFSDNYRSAGAMVNPGISISHVSAMNPSVTLNETLDLPGGLPANVPITNIFRDLNASILGIPLRQIVEDVLPLDDLPQLSFLAPIEQSITQFDQLAQQYTDIARSWSASYQQLVDNATELEQKVAKAEQTFKLLSKASLSTWIETIMSQQQVQALYKSQQAALLDTAIAKQYKDYSDSVLQPFFKQSEAIFPITNDLVTMLGQPDAATIKGFINNWTNSPVFNVVNCKEAVKAYAVNQFLTGNAPQPVYQLMTTVANTYQQVDSRYLAYSNALNQGLQEAMDFAGQWVQAQADQINSQLDAALNNIPDYIANLISEAGVKLDAAHIQGWLAITNRLIKIYDDYYHLFQILQKDYYTQLGTTLVPAHLDLTKIEPLRRSLQARFKNEVDALQISAGDLPDELQNDLPGAFNDLKKQVSDIAGSPTDAFQAYATQIIAVRTNINNTINAYTKVFNQLYASYDADLQQLKDLRKQYADAQKLVKDFAQSELQQLKQTLADKQAELINQAKGTATYQQTLAYINELQSFFQQVQSLTHQHLHYTFSTGRFRPASLGGVIDFLPNDQTALTLDVSYDLQLSLASPGNPPVVAKQSFQTDTSLSNFKVGLLQILYVDFEQVSFLAGSDVSDDFTVRVRDVDFSGFLSFFDAFKGYLKSLSDDLSFDITTAGATIGYTFKIPDFQTGYFNFFNLGLSASLSLPFDPERSLELHFGIGSAASKFGLTLAGIFGGQGYFDLVADPKKGIIGMDIVLEFGAIFHLDLAGIVEGTAYLVGGIYIRRYDGQYNIKGYILCVGRLRVIGLFSACLSFYLGLEGNGQELSGRCVVTASIKLGPFFEISVQCEMSKTIAGTKSSAQQASNPYQVQVAQKTRGAIQVVDSNLHRKQLYSGEQLYVTIDKPANPVSSQLSSDNITIQPKVTQAGKFTHFTYDTDHLPSGDYELHLGTGRDISVWLLHIFHLEDPNCNIERDEINVSDYDYYASYYL